MMCGTHHQEEALSVPVVTAVRLTGAAYRAELPLLVLGPSLGTSASALWTECAAGLTDVFDVVAWDLPGHGYNYSVPEESFTMSELADGVLRVLEEILEQRDQYRGSFAYAGDSVGGSVGLQLLLDHPGRVASAVLLCTGATIGSAATWAGRLGQVSVSGTSVLVPGSTERWFGPGFIDRAPATASALLHALQDTDDRGYIQVCEALAGFDVRERLGEIGAPVLAVAGSADSTTPTEKLREIADGVLHGRLVELPGAAHLVPAEEPGEVARLIRQHVLGEERVARGPDLPTEFEDLIALHTAGDAWDRPGLDARSRSLITLTALIVGRDLEDLASHLLAARAAGLSDEEIKELIVHNARYCGLAEAGEAFGVFQQVLE